MPEASSSLTVSRSAQRDMGARHIVLELDGDPWVTLHAGQSATRPIAPGRHELKAHNTLLRKSALFEAAPGEELRFVAANREGPGTWFFMILGAPLLYLVLEREPPR